ncbi:MAG: hypothetical protein DRH11_13265 [Deltaproteobacteria bacterium]|nr:MAG: hypothetical protein DRH11_13265 [Deltaproteobacteria bacterium]
MEDNVKSKGKSGFIIAVIAIFVFVGLASYNYWKFKTQKEQEAKREEVVPVETISVQRRQLDTVLELTGNVQSLMEVYVHPKVPGEIIERILVERGDYVRKGSLIAILEKTTVKARIKEAEAGLRSARAKLNEVEANLDFIKKDRLRLQRLAELHVVSQQEFDQIDAKYRAILAAKKLAIAQIERIRASLNLLDILLRDHDVYSPISGYVSARYVDAGTMSDSKKPIVRISMEKTVKIVATVTEEDYPLIRKGMEAEVRVDAFPQRVFKGTVSVINPTLDPATRTGQIEIHVENRDLTLRSGMFARMHLALGEREALVVHKDALNRLPGTGNYYVYVVKGGKAIMKNIKIGASQENHVEIKEGLKEGEQVVVKGQNRLRDGTLVRVMGQGTREGR